MPFSRREFLATSAATAASFTLLNSTAVFAAGVSDIRVATIGVRGRGENHLYGLADNIVAICDVDEEILQQRADKFEEKTKRKVERIGDYRKLLDRKDIDAVTIATPNHTHALIAVAAAQAGKDVYCEKPIAQTIWESRQVVAAARKYDRIIQCGTPTQIYTSPANPYVADFVAHMNPLGVLTARDAMVPAPRPAPPGLTLPAETPLRAAMQALADARGRILLTDGGQIVGMLTDAAAVAALVAPRGQQPAPA